VSPSLAAVAVSTAVGLASFSPAPPPAVAPAPVFAPAPVLVSHPHNPGVLSFRGGPFANANRWPSRPPDAVRIPGGPAPVRESRSVLAGTAENREEEGLSVAGQSTLRALALNSISSAPVQSATSNNWSGYTLANARYTGVGGTFTVPSAHYLAGSSVCEWVGIDGWADSSLLQAGVDEIPGTGGHVLFQPWWEVLPAPQIPVFSVEVQAGDTVRVTIGQTGLGKWAITLSDVTNGETFETLQNYDGPASSAEWVVEADTPDNGGATGTTMLAPFVPNVSFSDLSVGQAPAARPTVSRVVMVQRGQAVSVPSSLEQGEFSVAYATAAPPAQQRFTIPSTVRRAAFNPSVLGN
jgi:Peptidase A4 family